MKALRTLIQLLLILPLTKASNDNLLVDTCGCPSNSITQILITHLGSSLMVVASKDNPASMWEGLFIDEPTGQDISTLQIEYTDDTGASGTLESCCYFAIFEDKLGSTNLIASNLSVMKDATGIATIQISNFATVAEGEYEVLLKVSDNGLNAEISQEITIYVQSSACTVSDTVNLTIGRWGSVPLQIKINDSSGTGLQQISFDDSDYLKVFKGGSSFTPPQDNCFFFYSSDADFYPSFFRQTRGFWNDGSPYYDTRGMLFQDPKMIPAETFTIKLKALMATAYGVSHTSNDLDLIVRISTSVGPCDNPTTFTWPTQSNTSNVQTAGFSITPETIEWHIDEMTLDAGGNACTVSYSCMSVTRQDMATSNISCSSLTVDLDKSGDASDMTIMLTVYETDYDTYTPGTYIINVEGAIDGTSVTSTTTWTFTLSDPCDPPNSLVVDTHHSVASTHNYIITDAMKSIDLPQFIISPSFCKFDRTVGIMTDTYNTVTETSSQLEVYYDTDLNPVGNDLSVTVTAKSKSDYQINDSNAITTTETFTISFQSPCDNKNYVTITPTTQLTEPTNDYSGASTQIEYNPYQISPSFCTLQVNCDSVTTPAGATASFNCPTNPVSFPITHTFDSSSYESGWAPGSYTYNFKVAPIGSTDPTLEQDLSASFQLVDPCASSSSITIGVPTMLQQQYTILDSAKTMEWTSGSFTVNPTMCNTQFSKSFGSLSSYLTFDESTQSFSILIDDSISLVDKQESRSYSATVEYQVLDYGSSQIESRDITIDIVIRNPCADSSKIELVAPSSIPAMSYVIAATEITFQPHDPFTVQVVATGLTTTLCGNVEYKATQGGVELPTINQVSWQNPIGYTKSSQKFRVHSTDTTLLDTNNGLYTITVNATLEDYDTFMNAPYQTKDTSIQYLGGCSSPTTFSSAGVSVMQSNVTNKYDGVELVVPVEKYTISPNDCEISYACLSVTHSDTTSPISCTDFTVTLQSNGTTDFRITADQNKYATWNPGTYTITIEGTATVASTTQQSTFTMTLTDPCDPPTVFRATSNPNQNYIITHPKKSYTALDFDLEPSFCTINYSASWANLSNGNSAVQATGKVLEFFYDADLSPLTQTQTITITGIVETKYSSNTQTDNTSFTLSFDDPCTQSSIQIVSSTQTSLEVRPTYDGVDAIWTYTPAAVSDSVGLQTISLCATTISCNKVTPDTGYSCLPLDQSTNEVNFKLEINSIATISADTYVFKYRECIDGTTICADTDVNVIVVAPACDKSQCPTSFQTMALDVKESSGITPIATILSTAGHHTSAMFQTDTGGQAQVKIFETNPFFMYNRTIAVQSATTQGATTVYNDVTIGLACCVEYSVTASNPNINSFISSTMETQSTTNYLQGLVFSDPPSSTGEHSVTIQALLHYNDGSTNTATIDTKIRVQSCASESSAFCPSMTTNLGLKVHNYPNQVTAIAWVDRSISAAQNVDFVLPDTDKTAMQVDDKNAQFSFTEFRQMAPYDTITSSSISLPLDCCVTYSFSGNSEITDRIVSQTIDASTHYLTGFTINDAASLTGATRYVDIKVVNKWQTSYESPTFKLIVITMESTDKCYKHDISGCPVYSSDYTCDVLEKPGVDANVAMSVEAGITGEQTASLVTSDGNSATIAMLDHHLSVVTFPQVCCKGYNIEGNSSDVALRNYNTIDSNNFYIIGMVFNDLSALTYPYSFEYPIKLNWRDNTGQQNYLQSTECPLITVTLTCSLYSVDFTDSIPTLDYLFIDKQSTDPTYTFRSGFGITVKTDQNVDDTRSCVAESKKTHKWSITSNLGASFFPSTDACQPNSCVLAGNKVPDKIYFDSAMVASSTLGTQTITISYLDPSDVVKKSVTKTVKVVDSNQAAYSGPSSYNNLPFAAQDVFNLNFKWTMKFWNETAYANLEHQYNTPNATYLIDPNSCLFYSKFGIERQMQPTSWRASCGDTIRFDMTTFLDGADVPSIEAVADYIQPRKMKNEDYFIDWDIWVKDQTISSDWIDKSCRPSSSKNKYLCQDFMQLGVNKMFGLRWLFQQNQGLSAPYPARLKQSIFDYTTVGDYVYDSAIDGDRFEIHFTQDSNTFTSMSGIQLLGSQSDYEGTEDPITANYQNITQFGIYYRLRTCSGDGKLGSYAACTGDHLKQLLGSDKSVFEIHAMDQKVIINWFNQFVAKDTFNCLYFTPTISVTSDYYDSVGASHLVITANAYPQQLELNVNNHGSQIPDCTHVRPTLKITPWYHGATEVETDSSTLEFVYKIGCPRRTVKSVYSGVLTNGYRDTNPTVTMLLGAETQVDGNTGQNYYEAELKVNDVSVTIGPEALDSSGNKITNIANCCVENHLVAISNMTIAQFVEPVYELIDNVMHLKKFKLVNPSVNFATPMDFTMQYQAFTMKEEEVGFGNWVQSQLTSSIHNVSVSIVDPSSLLTSNDVDCTDTVNYSNHTASLTDANITAVSPGNQKYTLGDAVLDVQIFDYVIGRCIVGNYTATYKDSSGTSVQPKSITFDSTTKKISIYSASGDLDLIPVGSESYQVTVLISATANTNLTASTSFTVTLTNPDYAEVESSQLPYFSVLGNSTATPPLTITMGSNKTKEVFDLGTLQYDGPTSDSYSITFDTEILKFAKIEKVEQTYSLVIDLSSNDGNTTVKSDVIYELKGTAAVTQASNGSTRTEDMFVKFKLILAESETEESAKNETSSDNSTAAANATAVDENSNSTSTDTVGLAPIFSPAFTPTWTPPANVQQYNEKIKKPTVGKITSTGALSINFDKLRLIENEDDFAKSNVRRLAFEENHRTLQASGSTDRIYADESTGKVLPGFSMYIEPDEMSSVENLNFQYKVQVFDNDNLKIDLEFADAKFVSTNPEPEFLVIEMKDFRDPDGKLIVEDHNIRKPLPTQLDADTAATLEVVGAAAGAGVGASFSFNVVLNLVVSQSLNQMLSSIKNLQVIVHLTLVNVIIPANASIFFAMIFEIIAFDPIDISDYVIDIFEIEETEVEDVSPNFEQLGYETASIMLNMGSMLLIWALELGQIPILFIIFLCPCFTKKCTKWSKKKLKGIFWNQLLTLIDGTFLVILIMATINVREEYYQRVEKDASYWFALLVFSSCFIEIMSVSFFLCKHRDNLKNKKNKKSCGYIYEDLQYKAWGKTTLFYPIISQLRLVLIAYVTIFLKDIMVMQVELIIVSTFLVMALIGFVHPLRKSIRVLIDEFVIILVMDLLFFSSDPAIDPDLRLYIGWGMIGILGLSILVNQGSLVVKSIRGMFRDCKIKCAKRRYKKIMKLRKKAHKNQKKALKETQIDKDSTMQPMELGDLAIDINEYSSRNSRRRMMPAEKRAYEKQYGSLDSTSPLKTGRGEDKSSASSRYQDKSAGADQIQVVSYLGIPMPEIEELVKEEDGVSNMSAATSTALKVLPPNEEQCNGCRVRQELEPDAKCILCELKDEVSKTKKQQRKDRMAKMRKKNETKEELLEISDIEQEIEASEQVSKQLAASQVTFRSKDK